MHIRRDDMTNLDIIELKNDLIDVVNKHKNIPTIVKSMMFTEILGILSDVVGAEIERERQALEKKGEEDGESI